MLRWTWVAMLLLVMSLTGCGQGTSVPYTDNSRDPEALATNIKQLVFTVAYEARTAREPADQLAWIVDAFDPKKGKMPIGNYGSIYDELVAVASELHQACESADGRAPDLNSGLEKLEEIAGQLPGDVAALK